MIADDLLRQKYETLKGIISGYGKVAIAFSGGVDSSLLLWTAVEVFGDAVTAMQARSPLQTRDEIKRAVDVADTLNASLKVFDLDPFSWPDFTANSPERCYHCKKRIYQLFKTALLSDDVLLLDGSNMDDLQDVRPGLKAIRELGIKMPLVAAKLNKREIRCLSKYFGLPTWDHPSSSCLATRIPFGITINRTNISLVAQSEDYLHALGFSACRVRLTGNAVTIELAKGGIDRIASYPVRADITRFFTGLGVKKVSLDLAERAGISE